MTYQVEINGRPSGQAQDTEQAAINAYAAGSNYEVRREGFLVEVVLIDTKGRYHSKAQVTEITAVARTAAPADLASASQVRYIRDLARRSPAYAAVPANPALLSKAEASQLIQILKDTAQA